MNQSLPRINRADFSKWLHDVYTHLYDSPYLQEHPLSLLLVNGDIVDPLQRSQALRRVLLDAIQQIRPAAGVPAQSPDWRTYHILELRYLEGLSPVEAMEQMGLSKSQFFRDQARALELLTELLWQLITKVEPATELDQDKSAIGHENTIEHEAQHLFYSASWKQIQLPDVLDDLQPVVEPLARIHGVELEIRPLFHLPAIRADRVMLRQTLLNVLTYALTSTRDDRLVVEPYADQLQIGIRLNFRASADVSADGTAKADRLALAAQFMDAMGGLLRLQPAGAGTLPRRQADLATEVILAWPTEAQKTLLIIDDNQGLVDLFQRYLANEPWHILTAANGADARRVLAEFTPSLIMLDIMMPEEDGWEILVHLKQMPATAATPVLICSVVNEPQLAKSLGAAGTITKPVTQESLLAALRPWC